MDNRQGTYRKLWIRLIAGALIASLLLSVMGCRRSNEEAESSQETSAATGTPGASAETPQGTGTPGQGDSSEEELDYSRELAERSQSSSPEDAVLTAAAGGLPQKEKNYTLMVYMIGSNLESRLGKATRDMEEMEAAGLDFSKVNLLVYTGGSRRWVGDVPANRNCVIDMSLPEEERIVAQTESNANMGAVETLSAFVNFCTENYPAANYGLIFWDHGGGPLWGYGCDELFGADSLLLPELQEAMEQTAFGKEARLDFVGFDACLMGSLESMALWASFADHYIASEELEPGDGWDYTCLGILNRTDDPREIAGALIDTFAAYYETIRTATYNPDLTLSCVDLSKVPAVCEALEDLSALMTGDVEKGQYASLMKLRAEAKSFGLGENAKGDAAFYYDLVDLYDLAQRLKEAYPEQAGKLAGALEEAVLLQTANVSGAHGVSLYYPFRNKSQYSELGAVYGETVSSENYTGFLATNASRWLRSRGYDWDLGTPEDAGDEYTLRLSEEQLDNLTGVYYTILDFRGTGGFLPYVQRCRIWPDEAGVIHLPKNLPLIAVTTATGETDLWPVTEIESQEDRRVFSTVWTNLCSNSGPFIYMGDIHYRAANILMSMDTAGGEITINTVNAMDGGTQPSGKNTVDMDMWEGLHYSYRLYLPVTEENGAVRPYTEWYPNGSFMGVNYLPVDESFGFSTVYSGELSGEMYCQIEIEDVNGDFYGANPVPLAVSTDCHEVREKTADGEIIFLVYEDHAAVSSYAGTDTELTVPDKVEGVPVTAILDNAFGKLIQFDANGRFPFQKIKLPDSIESIGMNAFLGCTALVSMNLPKNLKTIAPTAFYLCSSWEEAELPEGLESIGTQAFAGCTALKEITIPKSVTYLGEAAFEACFSLEKIRVAAGNPSYKAEDGALYTADGKTLLAWPASGGDKLTVKAGTEVIATYAVSSAKLGEVILPDSLKEIGNYAFYDCVDLAPPVFPEGLEVIGNYAFDVSYLTYEPEEIQKEAVRISLGGALQTVGEHAFAGWLNKEFTVSGQNRYFKAKDGVLMNKAGDALLAGSLSETAFFVLPEGTLAFSMDMLDFLDNLNMLSDRTTKHIVLPASVVTFPDYVNSYDAETLFFHCPAGSEAEKFCLAFGLPFDNVMETEFTYETVTTPKGEMTFLLHKDDAQLIAYVGEDEVLEIPSSVAGLPVRIVGNGLRAISRNGYDFDTWETLNESPNIKKVVLPEGVEIINNKALSGFPSFNSLEIIIPSTVKVIGNDAIFCSGEITIPEGIERLGSRFATCRLPGTVTITESLREIDERAFGGCRELEAFALKGENAYYTVIDGVLFSKDGKTLLCYPVAAQAETYQVPEGVEKVEAYAFEQQDDLLSITFPASLKEVGDYAFYSCSAMTKIVFSGQAEGTVLGYSAFNGCRALTDLTLDGVGVIGGSAFANCESLRHLVLPEGLKEIGNSAFEDTGLTDFSLPETLQVIGREAFSTYKDEFWEGSPDTIRLGPSVKEIGEMAFKAIDFQSYEVDPANETFTAIDGLLTSRTGDILYSVPSGRTGELTVPEGIITIEDWAFSSAPGVTRIHIPDSVLYIGTVNFDTEIAEDGSGYIYLVTICCHDGSFAHHFAMEYGIPFELE